MNAASPPAPEPGPLVPGATSDADVASDPAASTEYDQEARRVFTLWGKPDTCTCTAPRHARGECSDGCLCEHCACTCTAMCSVGGSVDQRYGSCRCGCLHHTKS